MIKLISIQTVSPDTYRTSVDTGTEIREFERTVSGDGTAVGAERIQVLSVPDALWFFLFEELEVSDAIRRNIQRRLGNAVFATHAGRPPELPIVLDAEDDRDLVEPDE